MSQARGATAAGTVAYRDRLSGLVAPGHFREMQGLIGKLIEKGYAYPAGGDVYFDVTRDEDYGKLCNRDPEQLEAGARIEVSDSCSSTDQS